jgi:hypothetical protein
LERTWANLVRKQLEGTIEKILKGLQNIDIACVEEKMAHQCATARTRIFGIARLGKQEELENIFQEELIW